MEDDDDDDYKFDKRAAPTRKRNFIKDPLVPGLDPNEDKNAEEVLQKLTGKRFSLTQLLKRKSKKDDSNKGDGKEDDSNKGDGKEDDSNKDDSKKDGSNKDDSNSEEANTETEEKQAESKND